MGDNTGGGAITMQLIRSQGAVSFYFSWCPLPIPKRPIVDDTTIHFQRAHNSTCAGRFGTSLLPKSLSFTLIFRRRTVKYGDG